MIFSKWWSALDFPLINFIFQIELGARKCQNLTLSFLNTWFGQPISVKRVEFMTEYRDIGTLFKVRSQSINIKYIVSAFWRKFLKAILNYKTFFQSVKDCFWHLWSDSRKQTSHICFCFINEDSNNRANLKVTNVTLVHKFDWIQKKCRITREINQIS